MSFAKPATIDDAKRWLLRNEDGPIVYHVGFLWFDRKLPTRLGERADKIGKMMWDAYEDDLVILTQRRIADGVCAYIAEHAKT